MSRPSRLSLWAIALVVAVCQAQQNLPPPKTFVPKPPPEQPVAFSHAKHSQAGIKCLDCHAMRAPGDQAGFPAVAVCMGCHATIRKESPEIAKLATFASAKKAVPWVRVYKVPKTVYFSHEVHVKQAKATCDACHGPVAEREAIGLEKSIHMAACMECHDRMKASNKCDLCHDSH